MIYTVRHIGGIRLRTDPAARPLERMGMLMIGQMPIPPGSASTMSPSYVEQNFDDLLQAQRDGRVQVRFGDPKTKRLITSVLLTTIEELPHRQPIEEAPAEVPVAEENATPPSGEPSAPPKDPETPVEDEDTGAEEDEEDEEEEEGGEDDEEDEDEDDEDEDDERPSKGKLRAMTLPKLRELEALYSDLKFPKEAKRPALIKLAIAYFYPDE